MKTPKVYLETTVFNFPFADDAPEYQKDTIQFFAEIKAGKYEPYTSRYVIEELEDDTEEKQAKMLPLIAKHNIKILAQSVEIERLADIYVSEGIIPKKFRADALHLAVATVNNLDFVVSYNFRHIVKRKTIILTRSVNAREGYKPIDIFSPTEVIENDGL